MLKPFILSMCLIYPAVVAAQIEISDEQRCVWSCLYGPGQGDPASAAYNACVRDTCTGGGGQQPAQDASQAWVTGRSGAGVGYAGVDGVRGQTGLYYFCGGGQSFLRVIGIDGGERGMIVEVDGKDFPLSFAPNSRNQPESAQPFSAPVIQALQSGSRVRVMTYDGIAVVDATLRGSSRALAQVISSC
ncbi:hypothetical protein Ga0080574_TMP4425 [Salipiger abyssi]|uniref:Uncharacterized protein n=1 Tax=Salipiger abyssi TaxID=1250539 RepID=A0A1P8UZD1_9RHOB|nr:hypothetical protein Ga0080574_TMP4425 [Salipiger abyssi]